MSKRNLYFVKQRLIGLLLLMVTVFVVHATDGDATIALITVPMGLTLMFTKRAYIVDDYFFEKG